MNRFEQDDLEGIEFDADDEQEEQWLSRFSVISFAFDPDQPRNPDGTWGSTGTTDKSGKNVATIRYTGGEHYIKLNKNSIDASKDSVWRGVFGEDSVTQHEGRQLLAAAQGDRPGGITQSSRVATQENIDKINDVLKRYNLRGTAHLAGDFVAVVHDSAAHSSEFIDALRKWSDGKDNADTHRVIGRWLGFPIKRL